MIRCRLLAVLFIAWGMALVPDSTHALFVYPGCEFLSDEKREEMADTIIYGPIVDINCECVDWTIDCLIGVQAIESDKGAKKGELVLFHEVSRTPFGTDHPTCDAYQHGMRQSIGVINWFYLKERKSGLVEVPLQRCRKKKEMRG